MAGLWEGAGFPFETANLSVAVNAASAAWGGNCRALDFYGMCGVVRLCVCWMFPEFFGRAMLLNSSTPISTPNDVADLELPARLQHLEADVTLALDGRA
jgi:hypothetical protein